MEKSNYTSNFNRKYDDSDIPYGFTEKEMDKLLEHLSNYQVKLPDEDEINCTINLLKCYMPVKSSCFDKVCFALNELKESIHVGFEYINRFTVILIGFIYLIGYFVTRNNGISPYKTILFLAPLPFIIGILDTIKGREDGMLELEMSCKISAKQLASAKLMISGGYTILLNILLSLIFSSSEPAVNLWRMTILWLTPFTFISGILLWITTKVRGYYTSGVFSAVWLLSAYSICLSPAYVQRFLELNIAIFIVVAAAGVSFLAARLRCFYSYLSYMHEGNEYIET